MITAVKQAGREIAFAVHSREKLGHESYCSTPRIYAGLKLAENDSAFFAQSVKNYKDMPPEAL